MKQSFTVIATFSHGLWRQKHLKTIDLLSFYGKSYYGFSVSNLYNENLEKHSFHNKHIWTFMKFYEVLLKTLPTIGNEKEQ